MRQHQWDPPKWLQDWFRTIDQGSFSDLTSGSKSLANTPMKEAGNLLLRMAFSWIEFSGSWATESVVVVRLDMFQVTQEQI